MGSGSVGRPSVSRDEDIQGILEPTAGTAIERLRMVPSLIFIKIIN